MSDERIILAASIGKYVRKNLRLRWQTFDNLSVGDVLKGQDYVLDKTGVSLEFLHSKKWLRLVLIHRDPQDIPAVLRTLREGTFAEVNNLILESARVR
jgi:hypothetical protein